MLASHAPRSAHLLIAVLAAGCAEAPWPTPVHEEVALQVGGEAADRLVGSLMQNLTAALDSAGPVGAIGFCSQEAPHLTEGAAVDGVDVKRTSTRVRNPDNAPDVLEAAALAWFEERQSSTGALPTAWVQAEGTEALRYYRPLVVNALCVQCHGPATSLAPEVVAALEAAYPDDRATGYLPGDFRGLIRVRIAREVLETDGHKGR